MTDKIAKLAEFIRESNNIVFFGGAGVSTESGVPDFRSKDGLYNQHDIRFDKYEPEYLLSHDCLVNEPEVFFEFSRQKLDCRNIKPNAAHIFLAELENAGKLKAIVTQNVDSLHQKAGSKNVFEIHGTMAKAYCMDCGKRFEGDCIFESSDPIPRCDCGGIIRCDVTLYGEGLPEDSVRGAVSAISDADMLIIGGTSLTVYPAANYVRYFKGRHLVIINKQHLNYPLNPDTDLEINEPIGQVFSQIKL